MTHFDKLPDQIRVSGCDTPIKKTIFCDVATLLNKLNDGGTKSKQLLWNLTHASHQPDGMVWQRIIIQGLRDCGWGGTNGNLAELCPQVRVAIKALTQMSGSRAVTLRSPTAVVTNLSQ